MGREVLTGWGRTAPSAAEVVRPADAGSVDAALASPGPRGTIARGLGRSYGDAAQNAGGTVVATASLDHIAWSDEGAGLLAVGAGTSLGAILRALVPRGWFVPVSPGTQRFSPSRQTRIRSSWMSARLSPLAGVIVTTRSW